MATQTDVEAAFSTTRIGALTYTAIDNKGPTTLTAGRYWHRKITSVTLDGTANNGALATAINASIGGTTHSVSCTFNAVNGTYNFASGDAANFTLNLTAVLAAAMGFASGVLPAANSYTSSKRPLYFLRPLIQAQSAVSDDYNGGTGIKVRVADDGKSMYSVSPFGLTVYNDFTITCERDTPLFDGGAYSTGGAGHAMMTRNATAAMPWAWQDFWNHVRGEEYFAWVSQTSPPSTPTADVYRFREDGAYFKPRRMTPDYGLWDLPFQTLLIGRQ